MLEAQRNTFNNKVKCTKYFAQEMYQNPIVYCLSEFTFGDRVME